MCQMRNGNLFKMGVSEICVKRIPVNQGFGVVLNKQVGTFIKWVITYNELMTQITVGRENFFSSWKQ